MVLSESFAKQSLKGLGTSVTSGHLLLMVQAEILEIVPQIVIELLMKMVPKEDNKTK
jgi:hypothetical protein